MHNERESEFLNVHIVRAYRKVFATHCKDVFSSHFASLLK